jgi:CheY-like chemotaxis protein
MDQKEYFNTGIAHEKAQIIADDLNGAVSNEIPVDEGSRAEDWVLGIHSAFQPYARFVTDVTEGLSALERTQSEQAEWYESDRKMILESRDSMLRDRDALLAARDAQISELGGELEKLKSEFSSRKTRESIPRSSRNPSPKRVLLLDPVELNRVLISHYFKGLPVTLAYAKTKEEASHLLEQSKGAGPYDLLLVDPGLKVEGEWISWIKGQVRHLKLVAFAAGEFTKVEEQAALGLGFDSCLSRSEPRVDLLKKLSSSLWAD